MKIIQVNVTFEGDERVFELRQPFSLIDIWQAYQNGEFKGTLIKMAGQWSVSYLKENEKKLFIEAIENPIMINRV